MQWRLWLAIFVLFMAFWKGDSGYMDLQEQLDDAIHLWTYGDLRVRTRDGTLLTPTKYNRYAYGTAIFSAPFVLSGRLLKGIFGDAIQLRSLVALFIPAVGALGAVFVYRLSRELNANHRVAFFTVLIFCVGGLLLSQARLFYAEVPFAACMLAALMWTLEAEREKSLRKALLAGFALGCGTLFHATALVLTIPTACVIALYLWQRGLTLRSAPAILVPTVVGLAGVLALNVLRYDHPFRSGYDTQVTLGENLLSPRLLISQAGLFTQLLQRVTWIVPAAVFLFLSTAAKDQRLLLRGLGLVLLLQWIFWTSFFGLQMFPLRYFGPSVALAAPGLCLLLMAIERRGERVWMYSIVLLLFIGLIWTLRGDDGQPPLVPGNSGELRGNFWFAPAEKARATDAPLGMAQWAIFSGLLASAAALLRWAYRELNPSSYTPKA